MNNFKIKWPKILDKPKIWDKKGNEMNDQVLTPVVPMEQPQQEPSTQPVEAPTPTQDQPQQG